MNSVIYTIITRSTIFTRSKSCESYSRSSSDLSCVTRAKEEEGLSDNFKSDARALAIRASIPRSVGLVASRGTDPHGNVLGHVPREILSDIYAKVPTNVCR